MHQLALALQRQGFEVSGSDDEIYEPAKSALHAAGLLPRNLGWSEENIHAGLDLVIMGMHAKADNVEYLKAKALNIKIYSYPEYVYETAEHKQRIVIAGSHGKTTVTSMIMHVLKYHNRKFDYLVGAKVPGFDYSVQLSHDAPIIVLEGDEYLASAVTREPKFLLYKHHIGVVTGVAWDHMNVFASEHNYVRQFDHFADNTPKGGILIFNEDDAIASVICRKEREDVTPIEYTAHPAEIIDGETYILHDGKKLKMHIFGQHNMQNVSAAKNVCLKIGITEEMFYEAIPHFKGASNRLEMVAKNDATTVFKDFAHAPSKLAASIQAVKQQFPGRKLIAVLELHTFSSLNRDFLPQYAGTMDMADQALVYINPDVVKHKNIAPFSAEELQNAYKRSDLKFFEDASALEQYISSQDFTNTNLLLMSSGNFGGMDIARLSAQITS
jgi:UDP-N-acetylmuramate: L-alanyl-gamma-D-glutamyl-meso-diaminopimelate ligase